MHTSLMALILVGIVVPTSDAAPSVFENYHVSEIVRVLSPNSFEAKLENYKPAPSVRFRVYLPGFDTQIADEPSKKLLAERLGSAKEIELRNTTIRSYFRIEGDLWLDGQPFWERPVSVALGSEKETDKRPPNPAIYQLAAASLKHQSQRPKQTQPVKSRSVAISELLDRQVDGSMLTEDMPLSEALELLSESVEPPLPLLIHWKDLQVNTLIEKDTPIGVEGFGRLKLHQALNAILQSAAGREPKPVLIADGGILILASQEMLQKYRITRAYDVRDLLAVPSTVGRYNQSGLGSIFRNYSR
jgi:hypothetical protein